MKSTGLVLAEKPSIGIEPATLPDRSRFGNHGTHTAITMVRLPSGLWVRSFNGSSSTVDCGSDLSLNLTGEMTLLAWIYPDAVGTLGYIISRGTWAASGGYGWYWAGTQDYMNFFDGSNGGATSNAIFSDSATWVFGAVTHTSANAVAFYRNGVAAGTDTRTLSSTAKGCHIGSNDTPADYFTGDIALPRIYNRVLSAGQIKKIFEAERHWFGV